ncbi:hypothetical protein [Enterobacter soli]|uniref:hypothetical protein n=1 Tax=Enterobacter soli TaxID=885040 RepID=UPI003733D707
MRVATLSFKSIIVMLTFFSCTSAYAVAKDVCLSPGLVKSMLSRFNITAMDDAGKETKKYTEADKCDKDAFKKTLLALDQIKTVSSQKIKNAPDEKSIDFFAFINEKVKKIILMPDSSSLCGFNEGGAVLDPEKPDKIIRLCILNGKMPVSQLATIIVHETRHMDGYKHVKCSHGLYKTLSFPECDVSFEEQGSHAYALSYMMKLHNTLKDKDDKFRVRALIAQSVEYSFNNVPFGLKKGGLMLDSKNRLLFFDGNDISVVNEFNDKITSFVLNLGYPLVLHQNGSIQAYTFSEKWNFVAGPLTDNYQKLGVDTRDKILDVYIDNGEKCYLLPSEIICASKDSFVNFKFDGISPAAFYNAPDMSKHALMRVKDKSGRVYVIPGSILFKSDDKNYNSAFEDKKHSLEPDVSSYAECENGDLIGVDAEGTVVVKSQDSEWKVDDRFNGVTVKKIIPYYWSKQLQDFLKG